MSAAKLRELARDNWYARSEEQRRMPIGHRPEEDLDESVVVATVDTVIEPANRGYQLLAKMGWTANTGLGRHRDGIVDPIRVAQTSNNLGIGRCVCVCVCPKNCVDSKSLAMMVLCVLV
jgi:hypothetical protein